jgi:hypothetical protein
LGVGMAVFVGRTFWFRPLQQMSVIGGAADIG